MDEELPNLCMGNHGEPPPVGGTGRREVGDVPPIKSCGPHRVTTYLISNVLPLVWWSGPWGRRSRWSRRITLIERNLWFRSNLSLVLMLMLRLLEGVRLR